MADITRVDEEEVVIATTQAMITPEEATMMDVAMIEATTIQEITPEIEDIADTNTLTSIDLNI